MIYVYVKDLAEVVSTNYFVETTISVVFNNFKNFERLEKLIIFTLLGLTLLSLNG